MGNSLCSQHLCFNSASMVCSCCPGVLCEECFISHMHIPSSHRAHSLSHEDIILTSLKSQSQDGQTLIYGGMVDGTNYIIKVQYCNSIGQLNRKEEEAALQRSVRHTHICRCLRSFIEEVPVRKFKFVMVIEAGNHDLEDEIRQRALRLSYFPESQLLSAVHGLISACALMEKLGICHRDIKPSNIFVFGDTVKIGDFGLSIQTDQVSGKEFSLVGTATYLSPVLKQALLDVLEGRNTYTNIKHSPFKSDLFSLGLTILHMASLQSPNSLNSLTDGQSSLQAKLRDKLSRLPYSANLRGIIKVMLEVDENRRMNFRQLQKWLADEAPTEGEETVLNSMTFPTNSKILTEMKTLETYGTSSLKSNSESTAEAAKKAFNN